MSSLWWFLFSKRLYPPLNVQLEVEEMAVMRNFVVTWEPNPTNLDVTRQLVKLYFDNNHLTEMEVPLGTYVARFENIPQGGPVVARADVHLFDDDGNTASEKAEINLPDPSPIQKPLNVQIMAEPV
jgi:hypothetical protein